MIKKEREIDKNRERVCRREKKREGVRQTETERETERTSEYIVRCLKILSTGKREIEKDKERQ